MSQTYCTSKGTCCFRRIFSHLIHFFVIWGPSKYTSTQDHFVAGMCFLLEKSRYSDKLEYFQDPTLSLWEPRLTRDAQIQFLPRLWLYHFIRSLARGTSMWFSVSAHKKCILYPMVRVDMLALLRVCSGIALQRSSVQMEAESGKLHHLTFARLVVIIWS